MPSSVVSLCRQKGNTNKGSDMIQRKLLTNGNAFKRTDGRWGGVVRYMDEQGNRKKKSFSGTTKQEANKKITNYIAEFDNQVELSDESKKLLKDSIQNWLEIFKFPSVEPTTYDRCECTAIQNGSNPVFESNILAGVEGHSRYASCLLEHPNASHFGTALRIIRLQNLPQATFVLVCFSIMKIHTSRNIWRTQAELPMWSEIRK